MQPSTEHIRHIMLFQFHKGCNATTAANIIQEVYGPEAITRRTCRRWFEKFRNGDFSLEDSPREGRPVVFDSSLLEATLEANPAISIRQLSTKLHVSAMTVQRHLKRLGKKPALGKWVRKDSVPKPEESTQKDTVD